MSAGTSGFKCSENTENLVYREGNCLWYYFRTHTAANWSKNCLKLSTPATPWLLTELQTPATEFTFWKSRPAGHSAEKSGIGASNGDPRIACISSTLQGCSRINPTSEYTQYANEEVHRRFIRYTLCSQTLNKLADRVPLLPTVRHHHETFPFLIYFSFFLSDPSIAPRWIHNSDF